MSIQIGVKEMIRLERREILESLVRQGVEGFDRLKSDCRRFEQYWEACCLDTCQGQHRRGYEGEIVSICNVHHTNGERVKEPIAKNLSM